MADLPTRDFDLYTRPFRRWKILVQPRKQSKSIDNRFLIIISRHTRLSLPPPSSYSVVSHKSWFLHANFMFFVSIENRSSRANIDRSSSVPLAFFNLRARVWLSKKNPFSFVALFSLHFVWTGESCSFEYNTGRTEISKSRVSFHFLLLTAFLTYDNF